MLTRVFLSIPLGRERDLWLDWSGCFFCVCIVIVVMSLYVWYFRCPAIFHLVGFFFFFFSLRGDRSLFSIIILSPPWSSWFTLASSVRLGRSALISRYFFLAFRYRLDSMNFVKPVWYSACTSCNLSRYTMYILSLTSTPHHQREDDASHDYWYHFDLGLCVHNGYRDNNSVRGIASFQY